MSNKKIFLIIVVIILIGFFFISGRNLRIKTVIDGATVELNNGAYITLLGIDPTVESQQFLNELKGEKVIIVPDGSQFFNVKRMKKGTRYPAYVLLKKGGNISSRILALGYSRLNENLPLHDSLENFKRLVPDKKDTPNPSPAPEPVIKTRKINYEEDDIILPPPPNYASERRFNNWYVDGNLNLEMLEEACDFNLPYTKTFANKLASKSPGPYNIGQICEIFDYCYNKWSYVNDPADREYVARASESISASLAGDCDDFAVLIASCIIAIGGHPCINVGYNPNGGHAFTEVDIAGWDENKVLKQIKKRFPAYNISSLATRRDGKHLWLNLDWQASYPGGKYYDCSSGRDSYPYLDGKWSWKKLN